MERERQLDAAGSDVVHGRRGRDQHDALQDGGGCHSLCPGDGRLLFWQFTRLLRGDPPQTPAQCHLHVSGQRRRLRLDDDVFEYSLQRRSRPARSLALWRFSLLPGYFALLLFYFY